MADFNPNDLSSKQAANRFLQNLNFEDTLRRRYQIEQGLKKTFEPSQAEGGGGASNGGSSKFLADWGQLLGSGLAAGITALITKNTKKAATAYLAAQGQLSGLRQQIQSETQKKAESLAEEAVNHGAADPNVIQDYVRRKMPQSDYSMVDFAQLNDAVVGKRLKYSVLDEKTLDNRIKLNEEIFQSGFMGGQTVVNPSTGRTLYSPTWTFEKLKNVLAGPDNEVVASQWDPHSKNPVLVLTPMQSRRLADLEAGDKSLDMNMVRRAVRFDQPSYEDQQKMLMEQSKLAMRFQELQTRRASMGQDFLQSVMGFVSRTLAGTDKSGVSKAVPKVMKYFRNPDKVDLDKELEAIGVKPIKEFGDQIKGYAQQMSLIKKKYDSAIELGDDKGASDALDELSNLQLQMESGGTATGGSTDLPGAFK